MVNKRIEALEIEYTKITGHTIHKTGHYIFDKMRSKQYEKLLKKAIEAETDIFTANPDELKESRTERFKWKDGDVEVRTSQCYDCIFQDKKNNYKCSKYGNIPKKYLFSEEQNCPKKETS